VRRSARRSVLILTAAPLVLGGVAWLRYGRRRRPGAPYLAGAPLLIAHRGGAKLAPENTLLAFERAISWWGADILELDVQPTRDGEAVVFHDATLDRTSDASGPIADLDLDRIRQLDAGFRFTPDAGATYPFRGRGVGVSTLMEVLAAFPGIRINIEIKDARVQERVWESIREADAADRVLIAAGRTRDRLRLAGLPVPVSAGKEELRLFIAQLRLGTVIFPPPVDALQVPLRWEGREIATPELVAAARRFNLPVHVWTVDEVDEINALFDMGVAGIITDRPDRLARILHDRFGRPLPPGPPDPLPEPFLEYLLRP
jgi:glycerophosphoryl diester phosphodiesterase